MQHLRSLIKTARITVLFFVIYGIYITACRDADSIEPNNAPTAEAGEDQNVAVGDSVILDAANSKDPDDDTLSYSWEVVDRPGSSEVAITDPYQRLASFTPDTIGTFVILLKVSDGIAEDLDSLTVLASSANDPPIAEAGPDQTVDINQQVTLDGSNSMDPEGDPLSYSWTLIDQPAGSTPELNNPLNEEAIFIPDAPGSYSIQLEVSDGEMSGLDTVIVTTGGPRITSLEPDTGPYQTLVEISGANFSDQTADITVRFNGVEATVSLATYNTVNAVVPEGAGTGEVTLTIRGETAIGPVFTYIPTITVSTFAGSGTAGFVNANGTNAQFDQPSDIAIDANDNLYVTDWNNHAVRKITPDADVTTFAGNGQPGFNDATGQQAQFDVPIGIDINDNDSLYVADFNNQRTRIIDPAQLVTTLNILDANDQLVPATFSFPIDVEVDDANNKIYISEVPSGQSGNNRIILHENDNVNVLAGQSSSGFSDGTGTGASFNYPAGITLNDNGDILVTDALNHSIREVTPAGIVTTLGGDGNSGLVNGMLSSARFNSPFDIIQLSNGDILIADVNNHVIRRIDDNNVVTTFAGNGTAGHVDGDGASAQFDGPYGLAEDSQGNIYIADINNHVIRKITVK